MNDADRLDDILGDWLERRSDGEFLDPEDVIAANPGLEGPLRARFGALAALDEIVVAPSTAEDQSVISRLSEDGESLRPVLLRETASDEMAAPLVRAGSPETGAEGRYQVVGEIARGGVGVVLKGHDVDLGRDVAMKVLLDRHSDNPDVLQRFVEEAQIGGQLQHPGIVPVYEMGLRQDRRPYFTMKLVKGKTLSELLQLRKDTSEDRRRFLSIFESICQTVGYAHARGVIHRDLKPSNVMIGAFGEVLVVDWGMGKVLRRGGVADEKTARANGQTVVQTVRSESEGSASRVGSILGTLRYMPPEQARGELESVDERSDVFALGGILCEILTGHPPYTAESQQDLMQQAAAAQLDDAYERLAESSADPTLIGIARACLAPAREARPKDAVTVAKQVGQHLSDVEERAQRAQVDAAEAKARAAEEEARAEKERASAERERAAAEQERARADHERAQADLAQTARRRTRMLAVSVVAFVLVAVGGWLWIESERGQRERAATRLVTEALEDANALRGRAELSDDLQIWEQAVAAAERAVKVAERDGVDAETLVLARARGESVAAGSEAAARRAAQRAEDAAFLARIDKIAALDDVFSRSEAYAREFRAHGIDLLSMEPEAGAEALRATAIQDTLVARIHRWLDAELGLENFHRTATGHTGEGDNPGDRARHLMAVLDVVDDDALRRRVRRATDLETLRTLASEVDPAREPADSLFFLANKLGRHGQYDVAAELAHQTVRHHPASYWANFSAALFERELGRLQAALPFATAALALRPRSPDSHSMVSGVLGRLGEYDAAEHHARERLRLDPDEPRPHGDLGVVLWRKRDFVAAVAATRAMLDRATTIWERSLGYVNLGVQLIDQGRPDEGKEALAEALRLLPDGAFNRYLAHFNLGVALQAEGDLVGAEQAFRDAIAHCRPPESNGGPLHHRLGTVLVARGLLDEAEVQYREAVRLWPSSAAYRTDLALALWRGGQTTEAEAQAREVIRVRPGYAPAYSCLGMLLYAKGERAAAIEVLRQATALAPSNAIDHWRLGTMLTEQADYDGATSSLRRATQLDAELVDAHYRLGWVLGSRDPPAALAAFERVLALDPEHAWAWCLLGLTHWKLRDLGPARAAVRRGHALGSRREDWNLPSASWLSDLERLVALQDRVALVATRKAEPEDAEDRAWLARAASSKGLFVLAARLFNEAFEQDPTFAGDPTDARRDRVWAASAALQASALEGGDALSAEERRTWRQRALTWIRADLAFYETTLEADPLRVARFMYSWIHDADLASVRDDVSLGSLAEDERQAWRAFWSDVHALLGRAQALAKRR